MEVSEIADLVESFRKAARSAVDCGFNGIEIHGANGYVIDQFLKSSCNKRTDAYGGCVANRCRFCLEVLDAIVEVCAGYHRYLTFLKVLSSQITCQNLSEYRKLRTCIP